MRRVTKTPTSPVAPTITLPNVGSAISGGIALSPITVSGLPSTPMPVSLCWFIAPLASRPIEFPAMTLPLPALWTSIASWPKAYKVLPTVSLPPIVLSCAPPVMTTPLRVSAELVPSAPSPIQLPETVLPELPEPVIRISVWLPPPPFPPITTLPAALPLPIWLFGLLTIATPVSSFPLKAELPGSQPTKDDSSVLPPSPVWLPSKTTPRPAKPTTARPSIVEPPDWTTRPSQGGASASTGCRRARCRED